MWYGLLGIVSLFLVAWITQRGQTDDHSLIAEAMLPSERGRTDDDDGENVDDQYVAYLQTTSVDDAHSGHWG